MTVDFILPWHNCAGSVRYYYLFTPEPVSGLRLGFGAVMPCLMFLMEIWCNVLSGANLTFLVEI